MATQLIGSGAYLSPAHQPALTKPALLEPVKSAIAAIRSAFNEATAASHIYDGLLACDVPRDVAARRTFEMLYAKRDTHKA
ncbi:MAG: hypothetical protein KDJ18_13725 [Hyphomicrobiaceae bacterium]|nr:hypothetical protein [Hyphomicrobiaceae bacterium]